MCHWFWKWLEGVAYIDMEINCLFCRALLTHLECQPWHLDFFSLRRTWDKNILSDDFRVRICIFSFYLEQEFISEWLHCSYLCVAFISLIIGICWHCVCLLVEYRIKRRRKKKKSEREKKTLGCLYNKISIEIPKVLSSIIDWTIMMSLTLFFELLILFFLVV